MDAVLIAEKLGRITGGIILPIIIGYSIAKHFRDKRKKINVLLIL